MVEAKKEVFFKNIDICIPTYKRPSELLLLLESILETNDFVDLVSKIIVVDNDYLRTGESVVSAISQKTDVPIIYLTESRKGVVHVRNTALTSADAEFVAFVDDDEYVDKAWLNKFCECYYLTRAEIIFGKVESLFPNDTPEWIINMENIESKQSCGPLISGSTNNVFMHWSEIRKHNQFFDQSFTLSGGEDTEYFYRLKTMGYKLERCNSAVVYEPISKLRNNFRWYWVRNFRVGQTNAKVFGVGNKIKMLARIFVVLFLPVFLPFSLLFGVHRAARLALFIGRNYGFIFQCFGYRINEY